MYPNLRAEMVRKSVSISELAQETKMAYSTLSQKLNGSRDLSFKEAEKIKAALDLKIPLEILFAEEPIV